MLFKFLVLFILNFLFFNEVMGAQLATIKSSKAIVYSDIEANSPIGYLVRGKKVFVGDKKRKNNSLLPVVINRKIAWMKVDDLLLEGDKDKPGENKRVREHLAFIEEQVDEKNKDSLFENNYVRVQMAKTAPEIIGGDKAQIVDGYSLTSQELSGIELSAYIEHRHPLKRFDWGVGYQYASFSSDVVSYQIPAFMFGGMYTPLKYNNFQLELSYNVLFSIDARVKVQGVNGEYQGTLIGHEFGPQLRYRTYQKTAIILSALWKMGKLINLNSVENNTSSSKDHLSGYRSFALFAGLSFYL